MAEQRVFWPSDDLPDGPLVIWRGNLSRGVREVRYVPESQLNGAVEALRDLAGRCRDLDALIGDRGAGIYAGWKRAIDAADAVLGGQPHG